MSNQHTWPWKVPRHECPIIRYDDFSWWYGGKGKMVSIYYIADDDDVWLHFDGTQIEVCSQHTGQWYMYTLGVSGDYRAQRQ